MEMKARKVADAQCSTAYLVAGFHQDTVGLLDSSCHSVDEALAEVSMCLNEDFSCNGRNLQQSVRNTVCGTADETRELLAVAPAANEKRLRVVVERVSCTSETARPGVYSSRTATRDAQADAPSSWTNADCFSPKETPKCAMPNPPEARNAHDHLGGGA